MRWLSVVLVTVLSTAACGRSPGGMPVREMTISSTPITRLSVEIADTPAERARGLMGRSSLGADEGMAFLFDSPTTAAFWMKDTPIPLSIAFWDRDGRIVAILDMEPCRRDPCPTYAPGIPYVGAVEVNQGFFQRHGVKVGDRVALG
ncbi:MAG TPA: DUF192 domain-containing protein [Actinomycetota bacterium]|nr:DUF192 domain-containing protein [Actinomycetota bacterium]